MRAALITVLALCAWGGLCWAIASGAASAVRLAPFVVVAGCVALVSGILLEWRAGR